MRQKEKTDLTILHNINQEIIRLSKKHGWKYNFKVDNGLYETRIDIDSDGEWRPGNGTLPSMGFEMFCPDLIDFNNQVIIEYEEESGPNSGFFKSKKDKGHNQELLNPRDERRDWYYGQAKFAVLKIWETNYLDQKWKAVLYLFLKEAMKLDKRGVIQQ